MKHIELFKDGFDSTVQEKIQPENYPYIGHDIVSGEIVYTLVPEPVTGPADNEIWYTVKSESVTDPSNIDKFDVNFVSNTYEDGIGIMTFDGPITHIKNSAFEFAYFTSIALPKSLRIVEDYAFGDASLGEVHFMGTLMDWLNITFISNPMSNAKTLYINGTKVEELVIPDGVTSIGDRVFNSCDSLTSVTIPNGVTSIGRSAFSECKNITSVDIPNSVTNIGDYTFYGCKSLTSIVIPESVTSIGERTFQDCSSIISITFEGTIEEWNNITKGSDWNTDVPTTYVQCSDGQVTL